jgi:PAS domain S-box-containing protein
MIKMWRWHLKMTICLVLLCTPMVSLASPVETIFSASPKLLILYSAANNAPGQQQFTAGFDKALSQANVSTGSVQHEYLDISPERYPGQRQDLLAMLKKKYANQHFDLIITVFNAALDFLVEDAQEISPGSPAIALLGTPRPPLTRAGQTIQQMPLTWDLSGTISRALELFPDTRQVVFISGATKENLQREGMAKTELASWTARLKFEYTSDLTMAELLAHVARLPRDSIILYSAVAADAAGERFVPRDVARQLAAVANVPMFTYVSSMLDTGVVGGMMLDFESYGRMLGNLVAVRATHEPAALEDLTQHIKPIFDWSQIQRWHVNSNRLPKDSMFIHRPLTLWGQYRREVIVGATVIVLLCLSLLGALVLVRRRRSAELAARQSAESLRQLKEETEARLTRQVSERTRALNEEVIHRTEAEGRAWASEFKYRLMADNSLDILWRWNLRRECFTYVSPAIERLSGITVEDFLALSVEDIFVPESLNQFRLNIRQQNGVPNLLHNLLELAFLSRRGEPLWTESIVTLVGNSEKGEPELIGISRDITLKRRAQEEQRQFVSMVSHEFRTPLAIIRATAERMAGHTALGTAPNAEGFAKIERSVDWLTALLDGFLNEDRLNLLSQGINHTSSDPAMLLREAAGKAAEAAIGHEIRVHTEHWAGEFMMDAGLIGMVMLTLAENAVKHTPAATRIDLSVARSANQGLDLVVADNGPGIPEDELPMIGNKFFRGRTAHTTYGSGLGMYLAKNIIRLHGGTLSVSNRREGGAYFHIHLPDSSHLNRA